MSKLRRVLLLLLLIFAAAGWSNCSRVPREASPNAQLAMIQSVEKSIRGLSWVSIMEGHGPQYLTHCGVFSINRKEHLWLTAGHCILDAGNLQIDHRLTSIETLNTSLDLAILRSWSHPEVEALTLQKFPPVPREDIFIIGYPLGALFPILMQGEIILPRIPITGKSYLLTSARIAHGISGSPVLNNHGEVLSVVQIGLNCYVFCELSGGSTYEELVAFTEGYWEK